MYHKNPIWDLYYISLSSIISPSFSEVTMYCWLRISNYSPIQKRIPILVTFKTIQMLLSIGSNKILDISIYPNVKWLHTQKTCLLEYWALLRYRDFVFNVEYATLRGYNKKILSDALIFLFTLLDHSIECAELFYKIYISVY